MAAAQDYNALAKVYYRPIEAAIRWSGLTHHERTILGMLKRRQVPEPDEFPEWPHLRLNAERLFDAIRNRDLPCGVNGVTVHRKPPIESPSLTIRHVDLKAWMSRNYPEERPPFLFSATEQRMAQPAITADTLSVLLDERDALLIERDTLRARLAERDRELEWWRRERPGHPLEDSESKSEGQLALSLRADITYLHIIGSLVDLLLGQSPSGQPHSVFKTQQAIIEAIVARHGEKLGIAQRTLERKFAAAKRALDG